MMPSLMISLTPSPSSISLPSSSPQHQQIRKESHSNNKLDNLSIIEVALSILDDGIDSGSGSDNEDNDNDNDNASDMSTSSPRNRTPSNADSLNAAVRDRTYSDINPNDTRVLLRLNSSEDSADSTDVVQLSSTTDSLQVTAHDEEPIVFSPLKSNKWWMERGIRDSRKAVENSARRIQFGLTEGAAEFGEQHKKGLKEALGNLGEKHKQGLKEAFATFGEKHKEGMKKAAGKIGDKFISGSSSLGFFIFLTASVTKIKHIARGSSIKLSCCYGTAFQDEL
ncbi:hypothetical protein FRACYDRAFT_265298 [Fragilariopsis cylindrus CCMP1102]|uniref:Uncharacterized protein n=1 Tax=Fragilariopsis cylindrus CCMP1102 TaxID=635003 RepID=A0A1E7EM73_9STRA|nr:hypothetical protein FRACYDRAFT_265298 [Fragilariopsis cylindrus CCMP1102]|eukprot:OEU06906.1 hypothetical protein FRACYDRAFT_265298 [Fragilariopsis cylindrus CCMP1102]